jgi:hypothetical protein
MAHTQGELGQYGGDSQVRGRCVMSASLSVMSHIKKVYRKLVCNIHKLTKTH